MKKVISTEELNARVNLSRQIMSSERYDIDNVFKGDECGWPGDFEGRSLLAFVDHYKINGTKIPCMDLMIDQIPEKSNGRMFFGPEPNEVLHEQQLSGHSWYLRGLCEYYEAFGDERALNYLNATFEKLYLPTTGRFAGYPLEREEDYGGGVGGHSAVVYKGWYLSTDIGCAYMSVDGLSHYYKVTKNADAKKLIDEMAECFDKMDKVKIQAQTHCSLTAARGFVRMFEVTGDKSYLEKAERLFKLYITKGMTYTYENFNWFGKGNTWTEPCAIVDSVMLAHMLYKKTGNEDYRVCASRIYFNGLAASQRPNGGAGTDTTVSDTEHFLKLHMYEATGCCTMRFAEALWYVNENKDDFYANVTGTLKKDEFGRYMDGDLIYASPAAGYEGREGEALEADGLKLYPLIKYYKLADVDDCKAAVQKVIFK